MLKKVKLSNKAVIMLLVAGVILVLLLLIPGTEEQGESVSFGDADALLSIEASSEAPEARRNVSREPTPVVPEPVRGVGPVEVDIPQMSVLVEMSKLWANVRNQAELKPYLAMVLSNRNLQLKNENARLLVEQQDLQRQLTEQKEEKRKRTLSSGGELSGANQDIDLSEAALLGGQQAAYRRTDFRVANIDGNTAVIEIGGEYYDATPGRAFIDGIKVLRVNDESVVLKPTNGPEITLIMQL